MLNFNIFNMILPLIYFEEVESSFFLYLSLNSIEMWYVCRRDDNVIPSVVSCDYILFDSV